jgi:TldD protein
MSDNFKAASEILLKAHDLTIEQIEGLLGEAMATGADFVEFYFKKTERENWRLEDAMVKEGSFAISQGVGVRVIKGDAVSFAYSDEIRFSALKKALKIACGAANLGLSKIVKLENPIITPLLYLPINPISNLPDEQKIEFLHLVKDAVLNADQRICQVAAELGGQQDIILVVASDGTLAGDIRPMSRFVVDVVLDDKGRREHGYAGGGARRGYEYFLENNLGIKYALDATREAGVNLVSVASPAGSMPVVLGAGWPAVLLHEAIGHGLEGDFIRKGSSAFTNKFNTQVASSTCTIADIGNLPNGVRGSINIDDEGTPTGRTVLIENGILVGCLLDKHNARLMNMKSTGNARRCSHAQLPCPRMTNTCMLPGKYSPEEIIASVDKGLYVVNMNGGEVDITSGEFVFTTCEAYLIEKGKISVPVKDATLIGNGAEVLKKIEMVGNDLKFDTGMGTCTKYGQNIPVTVGQPTLKIREITVGGVKT